MTWFLRCFAVPEGGREQIPVVVETTDWRGQSIFPTFFFAYFQTMPVFTVYSDLPTVMNTGVEDISHKEHGKKS
jgi:hypothetical protein